MLPGAPEPEELGRVLTWLKDALPVLSFCWGLILAVVGGLWAYTKFVLERGVLPATRSWLSCVVAGELDGMRIVQILVHVENQGGSVLVLDKVELDPLLLLTTDEVVVMNPEPEPNPKQATLVGRLRFPHSMKNQYGVLDAEGNGLPFQLARGATFIQAGVQQEYSFITAVPEEAAYLRVASKLHYRPGLKPIPRMLFGLSRMLGLVRFPLEHVTDPHTAEALFPLRGAPPAVGSVPADSTR